MIGQDGRGNSRRRADFFTGQNGLLSLDVVVLTQNRSVFKIITVVVEEAAVP